MIHLEFTSNCVSEFYQCIENESYTPKGIDNDYRETDYGRIQL